MAKLIYAAICSLDGYIADAAGNFDWAAPGEEVHRFVNELDRPVGTYLLGRRTYDVLAVWDEPQISDGQPDFIQDFARIWRAADKIVYSRTLAAPRRPRTRVVREFDPVAVRRLKDTATRDLSIGGPELAAQAFRAGLVDECHLFLNPIVVGAGKRALPADVRVTLELIDRRRFRSGMVYAGYRLTLDS